MDIAYYLSELLGELGEVNVKGLGIFSRKKVDGYYHDQEGKFYPPVTEINFSTNYTDDYTLADFIGRKKKISVASAKYFIEKYVNKLNVECMMKEVTMADLGTMHYGQTWLEFKSANKRVNDPLFYGYPQIELQKLGGTSFIEQPEAYISSAKDEVSHEPVLEDMPVTEPEAFTETPKEAEPILEDKPITEPEAFSETPAEEKISPEPVIADAPVTETEAVIEAPKEEEIQPPPLLEHLHVDEPELIVEAPKPEEIELPFVLKDEPVREPISFGNSMEQYLRELEGESYIPPAETPAYTYPPVAEPEHTVAETQEELVHIVEIPGAVVPEPVTERVEAVPHPDMPLPADVHETVIPEPYTPVTHDIITPAAQRGAPIQEEEFVFDGKGYDNVDTGKIRKRSFLWLWITIGVLAVLAGAAAFLYYQHEQKVKQQKAAEAAPKPVVKIDTVRKISRADSLKKDSAKNVNDSAKNKGVIIDTTEKAAAITASAIDSTKVRYELIGINAKNMADANHRVINYKSLGIADAHIVSGPVLGPQIKISLGTYANRNEAINRRMAIIRAGKIRNIEIIKFNPKK